MSTSTLNANRSSSLAAPGSSRRAWYPVVLVMVGGLVYFNSLAGAFQLDDFDNIVNSPSTRTLWHTGPRAVGRWSLAVNYAVGGANPLGYHIVNIAIHLAAGLFLFGLIRRSLTPPAGEFSPTSAATDFAFAVALLWLVHPLCTAAVTYIVQRFESLMGLCFLACLYCVARSASSPRPSAWQFAALMACALGMGTKEVMVSILPVSLLYDRIFLSRTWREVLARRGVMYLGFTLAVGWLFWVTYWQQPSIREMIAPRMATPVAEHAAGHELEPGETMTAWMYLRTQPAVILHYLQLAVWPQSLCFDYVWPIEHDAGRIYGLGAIIVALLAASVAALGWAPRLGFLGLAFFLILAPTSSIMPLPDVVFEHRMYLPLVAVICLLVLAVTAAAHHLMPILKERPNVAWICLGVVALALSARTVARNRDYRNATRLWTTVLEQEPNSARAHFFLGFAADAENRPDDALAHFRAAAELKPKFVAAHYNAGWHLSKRKQFAEALPYYERVLQLDPRHALAHSDLGYVLARLERTDDAIVHFRQAVACDPKLMLAYVNWGSLHERARDFTQAAVVYRQGITQLPDAASLHARLGICLYARNDLAAALRELETAQRLAPGNFLSAASLAWIRATSPHEEVRDSAQALQLATQAVEVTKRKSPIALDALAAAAAASGDYKKAAETAREAINLLIPGDPRAAEITARLKLYEAGQPFRAAASGDLLPTTAAPFENASSSAL